MSRQHGLITRAQALQAGLSAREINALVRRGEWSIVRRGVYALTSRISGLRYDSERQRVRDDAACLRITTDFVRSHESAALVLGVPVLLPRHRFTHVTRPTVHGTRHEHGVKHHLAPYLPDQVVEVEGIRCLEAARTAVDIARFHGHPYGVVAMDAVLNNGTAPAALEAELQRQSYWPHITRARREYELSDSGAESIGETLSRLLVEGLGYGRPECQFGLCDGTRTAWADLRLGRHLFEFDGRVKYRGERAGGLSDRRVEELVWEEKVRQDWFTGFKCGMSRIVWDDLRPDRHTAVAARLVREYLDTCARFGTSIDDLAPYILPKTGGRRTA